MGDWRFGIPLAQKNWGFGIPLAPKFWGIGGLGDWGIGDLEYSSLQKGLGDWGLTLANRSIPIGPWGDDEWKKKTVSQGRFIIIHNRLGPCDDLIFRQSIRQPDFWFVKSSHQYGFCFASSISEHVFFFSNHRMVTNDYLHFYSSYVEIRLIHQGFKKTTVFEEVW